MNQLYKDGLPYSTSQDPYTDTYTELKDLGDLRKFLQSLDHLEDTTPIYLWASAFYPLEVEYKWQEEISPKGGMEVKGIIFQVND